MNILVTALGNFLPFDFPFGCLLPSSNPLEQSDSSNYSEELEYRGPRFEPVGIRSALGRTVYWSLVVP